MSYDISAGSQTCDHLQILERYTLDRFDFRTLHYAGDASLNMRAPINGASYVRLYFKGTLVNPADPVYGYSIVPDPDRLQTGYSFQKITFDRPVRLTRPLIEVSYVTRQGFCLKCRGLGRVVDWSVSPSGGLNHVTGVQKLAQQATKYIITSNNPFNQNLTTLIRSQVGKKFGVTVTDQDVAASVSRVMAAYQSIQRAQSTVQTLDPTEMIQDVLGVSAAEDPTDPTVVNVGVELQPYGQAQAIPLNLALKTNTGG